MCMIAASKKLTACFGVYQFSKRGNNVGKICFSLAARETSSNTGKGSKVIQNIRFEGAFFNQLEQFSEFLMIFFFGIFKVLSTR